MPDSQITCPSCGHANPTGSKKCEFCTLSLGIKPGFTRVLQSTPQASGDGAFAPGSLIANRYQVVRELGRGGMGAVYLVADDKLERKEMALKVISPNLVESPEMRKRFVHEVLSAQELTHESIVKVFHLDEYQGLRFFTMEHLPGKSLREVMTERFDKGETFNLGEAAAILKPVLSALSHAHSRNVIHRDLKPENIIVNGMSVKVLDFGLARIMSPSRLTSTAVAMGTAYYMSPEQLSGRGEVDHRTDIFAIGVILYEMLTGEIPTGRFELPSFLVNGLPVLIDEIIDKSLANNAVKRFQSVSDFDAAIQKLSTTQDIVIENKIEEKPKINDFLEMTFVYIEPGTFMMGSPENEPGRMADRERQHRVTLTRGYHMQTTPVTVGQWRTFIRDTGYKTEAETDGDARVWTG